MLLSLLFVLGCWLMPAIATAQDSQSAPIVLDGEPIFSVSDSGPFTARERAETINAQLAAAIASTERPRLQVVERNNLTTILLDGEHLLTVTERDALPGRSPEEQAVLWRRDLAIALQQARFYRTAQYRQTAIIRSAVALSLALFLHWLLGLIWRRSLQPAVHLLLQRENGQREVHPIEGLLLSLSLAIARTVVWLTAAFYVAELFPLTRQWSDRLFGILLASFTSPILTLGNSSYSIINMMVLALMLLTLFICTGTFTNLVKSRILRVTGVNRGAQEAIAILIRYSLLFIGTLVALQIWGLDISSLTILASALGVGIGFGLQDIAKNFGSGIVLVFERPIQVGDFVEVGEFQGTVERIGARSTLIRTLDQVSIIVPNSRFLEEEVINWSHDNPISRLRLPVGIAYGSDVEAVHKILLEAAKGQAGVLSTPPPQVIFKGFGDSSLDFELMIWTAEPSRQLTLKSNLYFQIEATFRQHQVEIPFPQRDLHLHTDNLPIALSPQLEEALRQWLEYYAKNGRTPS